MGRTSCTFEIIVKGGCFCTSIEHQRWARCHMMPQREHYTLPGAHGTHTCSFPREILGGMSYKGSRKNVKNVPLYCETCHLSGSSGNGAQPGFVPRGPHVALSRCRDVMDLLSCGLVTRKWALQTSCSLIGFRKQSPGMVGGLRQGHVAKGGADSV